MGRWWGGEGGGGQILVIVYILKTKIKQKQKEKMSYFEITGCSNIPLRCQTAGGPFC